MPPITSRTAKIAAAVSAGLASLALAGPAVAAQTTARHASHGPAATAGGVKPFQVTQILFGMKLSHSYVPAGSSVRKTEPLTGPDDITVLGRHLFTAFQNGVGAQGEPSSDGNTDSTVVEFTRSGTVIRQWNIKGKCDGLTADPRLGAVIATVNEDANSSVYTITPGAPLGHRVRHYHYNRPLPHFGGTDAISIYHGQVLISASAPGTTGPVPVPQPYPAVYRVTFHPFSHVAKISPLFSDEAKAQVANIGPSFGKVVTLGLTDPDSNEVVPASAARFAGDFMLTSQGDKEQIFLQRDRHHGTRLKVLSLSNSVDDTGWARNRNARLYATDSSADTVDVVTGRFPVGIAFTAVTPCDASNAPATCPGPGFPPNYLGVINPWTGNLIAVPVTGPTFTPKGLIFVGPGQGRNGR